jgi:hypothetical protein
MDYLPKDPAILVSSVNMLLRDEEFDTLEALCFAFSRDPKQIAVWRRYYSSCRKIRRNVIEYGNSI